MLPISVKLVSNKRNLLGKIHSRNFTTSSYVSHTTVSIYPALNTGIFYVLMKKIAIVYINAEKLIHILKITGKREENKENWRRKRKVNKQVLYSKENNQKILVLN